MFGQTNDINETIIEDIAAGMVSSGLREAGYRYVNMDAGVWAPERSPTGYLFPAPFLPSAFPSFSVCDRASLSLARARFPLPSCVHLWLSLCGVCLLMRA